MITKKIKEIEKLIDEFYEVFVNKTNREYVIKFIFLRGFNLGKKEARKEIEKVIEPNILNIADLVGDLRAKIEYKHLG